MQAVLWEPEVSARRAERGSMVVSTEDIRAHLASRRKEALVDLLMDQVGRDELLRERLMLEVAGRGAKAVDADPLYLAIDEAVGCIDDYVDWREAPSVGETLGGVSDRMETLLAQGHAAEVVELAAYGLGVAKGAFEYVDDSDGYLGAAVERLGALHLAACRKARPDPVELAGWLFAEHQSDDYGSFVDSVGGYRRVLGVKGLTAYRRLAEAEWAKVPVRRTGDDRQGSYGRSRITRIMEDLARASGDLDELVEVMSRDLSHSYAYLRIAEVLRNAGRDDEALQWAERGIAEFPTHTDSRLREFLAEAYHDRGRHEEAMALAWAELDEAPVLERYQALNVHAERAGAWPAWRDKAVARLREEGKAPKGRAGARPFGVSVTDASELVRVFLWEGDAEAAWEEAVAGGCPELLWRELATRREKAHPEDALAIYQRHVELALTQKNNLAYEEAVQLLLRIRAVLHKLGRGEEFGAYLASVRAAHKPKRNFMKLLDARTW